jgi:O-antigen/teichoic acid export membrane protein
MTSIDESGAMEVPVPVVHQPLRRSAIESMLTGVLGQAFLVVSGILVARMLTVHGRGAVAFVTVIPVILVNLGTLGVPRAVTFEAARPGGTAKSALAAALPLAVIQTIGVLIVGLTIALFISVDQPDLRFAALLALAFVPFGVVLVYGLAALQGLRTFRAFNAIRLSPGICYAAFAVILFALGGADVPLVITAWLLTNVIGAALVVVQVRKELILEQARAASDGNLPSTGGLLRFGVRSLVGSLSPLGSMNADQVVVGLALSPNVLGVYVVASSVCNLPRFVAQSLGLVAYPHVASLTGRAQARAMVRLFATTGAVTGAAIVGLELTIGVLIPLFFGHAYSDAVPIARLLLLSAFLFGMSRVLSDSLQGAGRPLDGTFAEAASWIALSLALAVLWTSLDGVRFAAAMVVAAGASLFTLVGLAFFNVVGPHRAAHKTSEGTDATLA